MESAKGVSVLSLDFRVRRIVMRARAMNGRSFASDCGTIARSRPHYGYQRFHVLLRREGWLVKDKLVYRLCCKEGLGVKRTRPRRGKSCQVRPTPSPNVRLNDSWSMDFLFDQLGSGRRYRVLTLVDNFSRESLAIRAEATTDR